MKSVLFLCRENSARSQMAERCLRLIAGDQCRVESAGADPKPVNPTAIVVMREIGLDISSQPSKSIGHFKDESFDYVITICHFVEEQCPDPPAHIKKLHWNLEDPSITAGSEEEKLEVFRRVRDDIVDRIDRFAAEELGIQISKDEI